MTMTLYCFGESGNAYKAALMLAVTGLLWTPRFVDFFNGETRTPAYRALNAMGEVPLLVDGDVTLGQSGAILLHLAAKTGRFGGATTALQSDILRWILFDNHKVSGMAGIVRFQMNFLPPDRRNPDVIAFLSARLTGALTVLESHLAQTEWLAGDSPTVADFSNCGYLYYPEQFGFDRAAWPAIDRWLTRIAALPGWAHPYDLMPGNPADRA